MSAIEAIFDGYNVVKETDSVIRFGTHIKTSIKEEVVDGVTKVVAVEKSTGKKLGYGEFETVVSNSNEDRHLESILVDGIDLKQIKKNPTVLWGHDYSGLPIGKIVKIWKENGNLMARVKLAVEKYDFAKQVYELILDGVINAVSLGGMVRQWNDEYTVAEKLELFELSVVPVGAHRDALITAKSIGEDKADRLAKSFAVFEEQAIVEKVKNVDSVEIQKHVDSLKALTVLLEKASEVSVEVADKAVEVSLAAADLHNVSTKIVESINKELNKEKE